MENLTHKNIKKLTLKDINVVFNFQKLTQKD